VGSLPGFLGPGDGFLALKLQQIVKGPIQAQAGVPVPSDDRLVEFQPVEFGLVGPLVQLLRDADVLLPLLVQRLIKFFFSGDERHGQIGFLSRLVVDDGVGEGFLGFLPVVRGAVDGLRVPQHRHSDILRGRLHLAYIVQIFEQGAGDVLIAGRDRLGADVIDHAHHRENQAYNSERSDQSRFQRKFAQHGCSPRTMIAGAAGALRTRARHDVARGAIAHVGLREGTDGIRFIGVVPWRPTVQDS